jgi:hypothetical protein
MASNGENINKTKKSNEDNETINNSDFGEGNTNTPKSRHVNSLKNLNNKKSNRDNEYKFWSFTYYPNNQIICENGENGESFYNISNELNGEINNWIINTIENITDKYIIGVEICPETKKTHLQGFLALKGRGKRFSAMKKIFGNTHIEKCNGSEQQNIKYCEKENRKIYRKGYPVPIKIINELYPWQKEILNIINNDPNDRSLNWFYDNGIGCVGKSSIIKYICATMKNKVVLITGGKKSDIINIIYNNKKILTEEINPIVIIDIPYNEYNNCSYSALEEIKNGLICNTKFEGGFFVMNSPHVIVCSNFYPNINKVIKDRWQIYKINKDKTCNKIKDIENEYKIWLSNKNNNNIEFIE